MKRLVLVLLLAAAVSLAASHRSHKPRPHRVRRHSVVFQQELDDATGFPVCWVA